MNRKTKKQWKYVLVLLFFLSAGVWYVCCRNNDSKNEENSKALTSVLEQPEPFLSPVQQMEETAEEPDEKRTFLTVYVCGAVKEPGVYVLEPGSRLYEAVAMAGGFSPEADSAYHNLARIIADGERIYILSSAESKLLETGQKIAGEGSTLDGMTDNGLINLNTATAEQLMELPGIGSAKAAAIMEYRAGVGQFTDIEEIMNVSGIGEAMFKKIRDKITVK